LKAYSTRPPEHPLFPYETEQSTSYCSDNKIFFPFFIAKALSIAPVAENDQQDPHEP
jgi:hypothetical protein